MISDLKPLETHIQMKILEMACSEIKSEEGEQTRLFCLFHEGGTMLLITALSIHVYHRCPSHNRSGEAGSIISITLPCGSTLDLRAAQL